MSKLTKDELVEMKAIGYIEGNSGTVPDALKVGQEMRDNGVNGASAPFLYNGTTFAVTPTLTFATPDEAKDPSVLSYVWAYKTRLWFIEKDSLDVWYLPVDSVSGELTKFPLGGVFGKGGSLLFGATWSNDAGEQGGLSEQIIFVTTEGEVAVYQGSNPGGGGDFSKVGVYRIGRPLGKKAHIKAGGDIVIATSVGFVPVSQAVQKDFAALAPSAVSYPIEVAWNEAVELRSGAAERRCSQPRCRVAQASACGPAGCARSQDSPQEAPGQSPGQDASAIVRARPRTSHDPARRPARRQGRIAMKYSEAFDIIASAMQQRLRLGVRYPEGAARLAALVALAAPSKMAFIEWAAGALDRLEIKPERINPNWDGSIG